MPVVSLTREQSWTPPLLSGLMGVHLSGLTLLQDSEMFEGFFISLENCLSYNHKTITYTLRPAPEYRLTPKVYQCFLWYTHRCFHSTWPIVSLLQSPTTASSSTYSLQAQDHGTNSRVGAVEIIEETQCMNLAYPQEAYNLVWRCQDTWATDFIRNN